MVPADCCCWNRSRVAEKSRLLEEFALRGARRGAWILRGQGLDQAAQRPLQILTGVAAGLVTAAKVEPGLSEVIQAGLGDHAEAICSVLPELNQLFGVHATSPLGPEEYGEARSVQALSCLLDALGSSGRPVLVLLDDCQWADQLTHKVLGAWSRRPAIVPSPVIVVAAFRSEEVPDNHPLRGLTSTYHLKLPAFDYSDVRKLAESMAGPLPDQVVEVIERLADGSPFMATAALRGLVECGALAPLQDNHGTDGQHAKGGWRVDPLAMSDLQSSRQAAIVLSRRIQLMPESTVKLLSVGAVLGREFDLFTASKLAQQDPAQSIDALQEAEQRHIVWSNKSDDQCVFVHDKLRETLLGLLPESQRRELHQQAALHLESAAPERVYALAYHFDAAGNSDRALPYALASAQQARAHHALELAEQQVSYRRTRRLGVR